MILLIFTLKNTTKTSKDNRQISTISLPINKHPHPHAKPINSQKKIQNKTNKISNKRLVNLKNIFTTYLFFR